MWYTKERLLLLLLFYIVSCYIFPSFVHVSFARSFFGSPTIHIQDYNIGNICRKDRQPCTDWMEWMAEWSRTSGNRRIYVQETETVKSDVFVLLPLRLLYSLSAFSMLGCEWCWASTTLYSSAPLTDWGGSCRQNHFGYSHNGNSLNVRTCDVVAVGWGWYWWWRTRLLFIINSTSLSLYSSTRSPSLLPSSEVANRVVVCLHSSCCCGEGRVVRV